MITVISILFVNFDVAVLKAMKMDTVKAAKVLCLMRTQSFCMAHGLAVTGSPSQSLPC